MLKLILEGIFLCVIFYMMYWGFWIACALDDVCFYQNGGY